MKSFKKPFGVLLFVALFAGSSLFVVEAKTERAFAQEATSTQPTINLRPNKWEALEMIGRGELKNGVVINSVYTQEELNGLIEGLLASKNVSWFLDDASVKLEDGSIEFSGVMLRPIKGTLTANFSFVIENGKPVVTINSAKYGIFRVPASFVERVGNFVLKKKSMADWFDIKNATWKDLSVNNGKVHIYVIGE